MNYKHYCINCKKEITSGSKLGRCKSCSKKGRLNNMFGKHHTQETKDKMSFNKAGEKQYCIKCGKLKKRRDYKLCFQCYISNLFGKNNPNWKGGIQSKLRPRLTKKYKQWRKSVFKRDNYTCQLCGQKGGKLEVHHIKSWIKYSKLRYIILNGLTLCYKCHHNRRIENAF